MTLEKRIEQLEEMNRPTKPTDKIHIHYEGKDPRVSCPDCMAMTEQEYQEYQTWLSSKPRGDGIKLVVIHLTEDIPQNI